MRVFLAGFLLVVSSLLAHADQKLEFLSPWDVLREDVPEGVVLDGNWLALHRKMTHWYVSQTQVAVFSEDGIISLQLNVADVVGLFRGVPLQEGAIEEATLIRNATNMVRSFYFRGSRYSLVVQEREDRNQVYFSDGIRSVLVYGDPDSFRSCRHPNIIWAGDIDRDGKPDLIADFDDDSEKNASYCVFLSAQPADGQFFRLSSCQFFSG